MREVGLAATELGPDGFLPAEPDAVATVLSDHGTSAAHIRDLLRGAHPHAG